MKSFNHNKIIIFYKLSQVKLNVGGNIFMTSRETLMRDSNSMLARLVSDDSELISDKVRLSVFIAQKFFK